MQENREGSLFRNGTFQLCIARRVWCVFLVWFGALNMFLKLSLNLNAQRVHMRGRSLCWAFNHNEGRGLKLIAELSVSRSASATLSQISTFSLFEALTFCFTMIHWGTLFSPIETCKRNCFCVLQNVSLAQIFGKTLGALWPNLSLFYPQKSNLSHCWFDLSVVVFFQFHSAHDEYLHRAIFNTNSDRFCKPARHQTTTSDSEPAWLLVKN